ncbi:MAG: response regulator transcription factor [Leptospiraceae bacterium]|nr:response regulator transcription factor [Leptospiraceae bacterium]
MKNKIQIISVEDSREIRDRIVRLISADNRFEMIGVFDNAEALLEQIATLTADIALVDLELPGMQGEELIKILISKRPGLKIAVFTAYEDQSRIFKLVKSGIKGYLLKDISDDLLLAELQVIYLGGATLTEKVAQKIFDEISITQTSKVENSKHAEIPQVKLTKREIEIINLIALGLNYKQISQDLGTSPHTIRRHIENIYVKLESHSRVQAIKTAKMMGIIE